MNFAPAIKNYEENFNSTRHLTNEYFIRTGFNAFKTDGNCSGHRTIQTSVS